MAFDRPIEADKIDDFNFFSAFVRAPLWILGGVLGGNASMNVDDEPITLRRLDDNDNENSPPGSASNSPSRIRVVSDCDLSSQQAVSGDGHRAIDGSDGMEGNSLAAGLLGLKRSKNLSWSDESGKSLVEYNTEVSKNFCYFVNRSARLKLLEVWQQRYVCSRRHLQGLPFAFAVVSLCYFGVAMALSMLFVLLGMRRR